MGGRIIRLAIIAIAKMLLIVYVYHRCICETSRYDILANHLSITNKLAKRVTNGYVATVSTSIAAQFNHRTRPGHWLQHGV